MDEIKRTVLLCNSISPKPLPSDFNLRLNQKLNTAKPGIMVPPWLKNKKLYVSAAAMAACIALVAGPLYTMYQQAGTITEPLPYTVQTALPATAVPTGTPENAAAAGPAPADGQTEPGTRQAVTTQQPDSPVSGGAASSSQESVGQSLPANQPQTPDNGYVQPQRPPNSEGAAENPVAEPDNTTNQPPASNDFNANPPQKDSVNDNQQNNSVNNRSIPGENDINAVSEDNGNGGLQNGGGGGSSRLASSIYYYQDKQAYADVLLVNAGSGANALKTWINQNVSALARYSSGPFQVIEVSEAAYQKIREAATTYSAECSVTTSQDSRLQAIRENLSFGYYVVFR